MKALKCAFALLLAAALVLAPISLAMAEDGGESETPEEGFGFEDLPDYGDGELSTATPEPTSEPMSEPTAEPTPEPTPEPTAAPTPDEVEPPATETPAPTSEPSAPPSESPSPTPETRTEPAASGGTSAWIAPVVIIALALCALAAFLIRKKKK